uniref:Uncharacterized protein n=1 Tax=Timema poppense TaxID=170557 RepID=A0A7R9H4A5_TIMPO|nr:unnamed protein product [Timema poppensis]
MEEEVAELTWKEERNRLSADLQAEHERSESLSKEVTELRSVLQDAEQLDKSVTQNHSSSVNGPASEPSITEISSQAATKGHRLTVTQHAAPGYFLLHSLQYLHNGGSGKK